MAICDAVPPTRYYLKLLYALLLLPVLRGAASCCDSLYTARTSTDALYRWAMRRQVDRLEGEVKRAREAEARATGNAQRLQESEARLRGFLLSRAVLSVPSIAAVEAACGASAVTCFAGTTGAAGIGIAATANCT